MISGVFIGGTVQVSTRGMEPIRIMLSTIDKKRQQARIAIDAPDEVEVWREELLHETEIKDE